MLDMYALVYIYCIKNQSIKSLASFDCFVVVFEKGDPCRPGCNVCKLC